MIVVFLLTGRYLEARARYRAGDALRSLLRTWRRPPAAGKESVRGVGSLLEDGEDADGPLEDPSSGRSRP